MTGSERLELHKQGITILRAQWDHRKYDWKIVKYNGKGWCRFGSGWYATREMCNDQIKMICESDKTYRHDE